MEPFNQFKADKQRALEALSGLERLLHEIGALGADTGADVHKVHEAVKAIESDRLRIALLGAFSDGKTSVIASWLGHVDPSMKIDMDESSDRLAVYTPEGLLDACDIVDTPGLFGDKERTEQNRSVMYEDITKRYISEAHLILYVVDATNPLKDSHSDIVRWVLRDLGKLSSTIFVINKMDEVADLKDPASFERQAVIKRDNLKAKLERAAGLRDDELAQLRIVCVAANPNGRGLPFWFQRPADYETRSRMPVLKAETASVLKASVPVVLRAKTGMDVIREVVAGKLRELELRQGTLTEGRQRIQLEFDRVQEDIVKGRRDVRRLASSLVTELNALDDELLGKLRPLDTDGLRAFYDTEIGLVGDQVGTRLQWRVKELVQKYAEQSGRVVNRVATDITKQLSDSKGFFASLTSRAGSAAAQGLKGIQDMHPEAIRKAVLNAQDLLEKVGLGIQVSSRELSKWSANLPKWAGLAGTALQVITDVREHIRQAEMEAELAKLKEETATQVKTATEGIRQQLLTDETAFALLSPQLREFEKILDGLRHSLEQFDADGKKIGEMQKRLEALTA